MSRSSEIVVNEFVFSRRDPSSDSGVTRSTLDWHIRTRVRINRSCRVSFSHRQSSSLIITWLDIRPKFDHPKLVRLVSSGAKEAARVFRPHLVSRLSFWPGYLAPLDSNDPIA